MTLLGASVLFNRGTNIHNQLRIITSSSDNPKYRNLLRFLNKLYEAENTKEQREKLQSFIVAYGEEVYKEYSKSQDIHGIDDFSVYGATYTLK